MGANVWEEVGYRASYCTGIELLFESFGLFFFQVLGSLAIHTDLARFSSHKDKLKILNPI